MEYLINYCNRVADISSSFEKNNSDLKRKYLVHNIELYNSIVANIMGSCGSFGTGYPFYALEENLMGRLPVKEVILSNLLNK